MAKFEKGLTLFEECLSVLGTWRVIALEAGKKKIMDEFYKKLPWTTWGRINWDAVEKKYQIVDFSDIDEAFKKENKTGNEPLYILWCEEDVPIVETILDEVLPNLEDVECISPYRFLYCPAEGWIIELWHHDGEIYIGFF